MPGGVQSRFLQVLESDQALAGRRVAVWIAAAALLGALAWFLWPPWGVLVHVGAAAVGMGIAWGIASARTRRFEDSMRDEWSQWMRFSLTCETLPEIHRRIRGGSMRNALAGVAGMLLAAWVAEVLLLALAIRPEPAWAWALPALLLNGLVPGVLLGLAAQRRRWFGGLRSSVKELVESGEIGVWGVL